jgi:hypothetical protein
MTHTERMVSKFINSLSGSRYRQIFEILDSHGLRPLGKSNTETLLYQFRDAQRNVADVLAFRLGPPQVISFPKSYWLSRSLELSQYLNDFSYNERPAVAGPVSTSQFSAGQIEITPNTYERIMQVCNNVCTSLQVS